MAWTESTTCTVETDGWAFLGYSTNLSGCEEIKGAPTVATQAIILEQLDVFTSYQIVPFNITIGEDEAAGAVSTEYVSIPMRGLMKVHRVFNPPVKLTAGTALTIDSSNPAAKVSVYASGRIE